MSTSTFKDYSKYYDLLYRDKDYAGEVEYLHGLIQQYAPGAKSILNLGCGTGRHDFILAKRGYEITGVDFSKNMLKIAKKKLEELNLKINFYCGDIRKINLKKKFDVVISMFAVMSYQTTNKDFENTLKSINKHLNPAGLFVFDVWYGPAVLNEKPTDRVKTIEKDDKKIIRCAHPVLDIEKQTVEVNYTVLEITKNKVLTEIEESHLMRFFFYQELTYLLEKNGFNVLKICPFMEQNKEVDETCWNISVIAKSA